MPPDPRHLPVLTSEVLTLLSPSPDQTYLDCTAGLAGHASAIAPRIANGTIILNDADPANLSLATAAVHQANPSAKIIPLQGNFADLPRKTAELNLKADLLLADLGFSSNQVESAPRGLSFQLDGPLDMRFDPTSPTTAADLIASSSEPELSRILREFGEEPAAGRIARKLVETRRAAPISTTRQLADIVRSVLGKKGPGGVDTATRTFQAFRIAVNDELGSLGALLAGIERPGEWLNAGAKVAVISFHSLEDRLVKQSFNSIVAAGRATHLTRGTIEASDSELTQNPRSRSAKLRAIRFV